MWQQCPQCKGSGLEPIIGTYSNIPICTVCNGAKIISQLTGLPPNRSPIFDSAVSTKQSNFDNRDLSGTLDNTNYLEIVKPIKPTLNG
jgi:hypothetical protein